MSETCVIQMPIARPEWRGIDVVEIWGYYAMPEVDDATRNAFVARVGQASDSIEAFIRKMVADGADVTWRSSERTVADMVEMGATADLESTWAVMIGLGVRLADDRGGHEAIAHGFGDAWIPRCSSAMQFLVPFDDAPNIPIPDGDRERAIVLTR